MLINRNPALWRWFVYAVVAEISPTEMVVKIGASRDPSGRYNSLLTGMPFESVMLYAPVSTKGTMFSTENEMHRALAKYHTRGEWFRIPVSEKAEFHKLTRRAYGDVQGETLQWRKITEAEALALEYTKAKLKKQGHNRMRLPRGMVA